MMIEVGLRGLIEINFWAAWNGILDLLPLTSSSSMYIGSHQSVTSPDQCQSVSRRQWRITYQAPVNKADIILFGSHFSTIIWLLYQIRSYQCSTTATKDSERGASFDGNYQSYISESIFIHQPTTVVHLCPPHLTYLHERTIVNMTPNDDGD